MKPLLLALSSAAFVLTGCDMIYGVSRRASVHRLPDLRAVKERIESYSDVTYVSLQEDLDDRTLTLTGLHAEDHFYLTYRDGLDVRGTLQFTRGCCGEVEYGQYILRVGHPPPQSEIDATWPVMKRIELDLARDFGLPELFDSVEVWSCGVDDPDRDRVVHP